MMTKKINRIDGARIESRKKDINYRALWTHLLSLNASFEAARAGKAGMEFARLAEDVKNTASRTIDLMKKS